MDAELGEELVAVALDAIDADSFLGRDLFGCFPLGDEAQGFVFTRSESCLRQVAFTNQNLTADAANANDRDVWLLQQYRTWRARLTCKSEDLAVGHSEFARRVASKRRERPG